MIRKHGQPIDSLEVWERLAGPKSPIQWQDDRSAKECARAWLGDTGDPEIPEEIRAVLERHPEFSEIGEWEAEPECLVTFDRFGGPANIDVMATMKDQRGRFVLAVEAKADESFGPLLGRALAAALERKLASPTSKGIARIEELVPAILAPARGRVPKAHQVRYQLLTAVAAALSKAHAIQASRAVVFIHEFRTARTDERHLARNRQDLERFLVRLGCTHPQDVFDGHLVGPFSVPGGERFPDPADLYLGKAVRRIGERSDPS
ncbi:MAG: hypothetical protein WD960_08510 [Gemmatimonadota bacterium]